MKSDIIRDAAGIFETYLCFRVNIINNVELFEILGAFAENET